MLNPNLKTEELSHKEYQRYARQIIIEAISSKGQNKIKKAKIICIGAGGLGSPALLYLTASGIGTIGILDNDIIDISNLQRQILYKEHEINKFKAQTAFRTLKEFNPSTNIKEYSSKLNRKNISKILSEFDIVIDCTDNFQTRYLISQYCYKLHKIHIYGAIEQFIGQVSVLNYRNSFHYYNLYSQISYSKPNSCNEIGIINTITGIIGILQATEAIKIITGIGKVTNNGLVIFNLLNCSLDTIKIKPSKLQKNQITKSHKNYDIIKTEYISIQKLNQYKPYIIVDIRTPLEFKIQHIKNAINIPLNKLKKKKFINYIKSVKERSIIIYCNKKTRSFVASQILTYYSVKHYILNNI